MDKESRTVGCLLSENIENGLVDENHGHNEGQSQLFISISPRQTFGFHGDVPCIWHGGACSQSILHLDVHARLRGLAASPEAEIQRQAPFRLLARYKLIHKGYQG